MADLVQKKCFLKLVKKTITLFNSVSPPSQNNNQLVECYLHFDFMKSPWLRPLLSWKPYQEFSAGHCCSKAMGHQGPAQLYAGTQGAELMHRRQSTGIRWPTTLLEGEEHSP